MYSTVGSLEPAIADSGWPTKNISIWERSVGDCDFAFDAFLCITFFIVSLYRTSTHQTLNDKDDNFSSVYWARVGV